MAKRIKQGSSDQPHTGDGKTQAKGKIRAKDVKFQGQVGGATAKAPVTGGRASRLRAIGDILGIGKHRSGQ